MKVHYVDDDDADLTLMLATAENIPDLDVSTSKSISGLFDRLESQRIDCVLLDINRPDAQSLEDDILSISDRSNLPVVLVTGGDADDARLRATLAGADGLIEKSALSREVLIQVLKNARARVLARSVNGSSPEYGETFEATNTGSVQPSAWLKKIQNDLDRIELSLNTRTGSEALTQLYKVREAVSRAKAELDQNKSISACVPMRWALKAAIDDAAELSEKRGITISLGQIGGTYFPKGSRELGYLGLRLLLRGLIGSLGTGDAIKITTSPGAGNGSTIILSLSKHCLLSKEDFFSSWSADKIMDRASSMSLRLSAVLLGTSRQDIVLGASVDEQLVSLEL